MKSRTRAACRHAAIAATTLGLISCGGSGSNSSTSACDAVISGFHGDLEAVYQDGDGGGGDSGDGDSGAGGGAGLGKVLGGVVRVISLADKRLIGETTTDTTTGLFTVRTCRSPEPLLITLKGQAGAKYYDEGKNALVDFGPEQELHVLVDQLDENIGVSAFTEAAYRYAINNLLIDPKKISVDHAEPLRETLPESELQLTVEQIRAANTAVLNEVNRVLPAAYQLVSLKSLPTPIDAGDVGTNGAISTVNRYGQATVITGAFAWMAAKFDLDATQPALDAVAYFARDMTDGNLNGFALDGQPASPGSGGPVYDPANIPVSLTVGANAISDLFNAVYLQTAAPYVDFNVFKYEQQCQTLEERYALSRTGTLSVRRVQYGTDCRPTGTPIVAIENFGAHEDASVTIKHIHSMQWTGGGTLVYSNGDVRAWGNNECGQLGNGKTSGLEMVPVPIDGIRNITSMASGYKFSIARDDQGNAFSWGEEGVLGLGESAGATCTHARPTAIPGLANIVTVHAAGSRAFAIDQSGHLYAWGGDCGGGEGRSFTPVRRDDVGSVVSMAANEHGCFALKSDGTLVGWGFGRGTFASNATYDSVRFFGDGLDVPRVSPTPLSGLTGVRQVASDNYAFYALDGQGRVWRWGGVDGQPTFAPTPTLLDAPGGGRWRHIASNINGVHAFAGDGKVYQIVYLGSEIAFVETPEMGFE